MNSNGFNIVALQQLKYVTHHQQFSHQVLKKVSGSVNINEMLSLVRKGHRGHWYTVTLN